MSIFTENAKDVDRTMERGRGAGRNAGSTRGGPGAFTKYLGYSVSCLSLCAGIVFLTGLLLPPAIPGQLRVMCGIVFVLMAIYRFFATRYKTQAQQRGEV